MEKDNNEFSNSEKKKINFNDNIISIILSFVHVDNYNSYMLTQMLSRTQTPDSIHIVIPENRTVIVYSKNNDSIIFFTKTRFELKNNKGLNINSNITSTDPFYIQKSRQKFLPPLIQDRDVLFNGSIKHIMELMIERIDCITENELVHINFYGDRIRLQFTLHNDKLKIFIIYSNPYDGYLLLSCSVSKREILTFLSKYMK